MTQPAILSADGLVATLDVDGVPTRVLDSVSLSLAEGEVLDIVGPSGSGKSTLLRALALLLPGATGALALGDGSTPDSIGPFAWRTCVSLVPQKPAIVAGTVAENLALPWRLKQRRHEPTPTPARMRDELAGLGLDVKLDRSAAKLSVGQQARLALARTLLTSPKVLLLDEAEAALDADTAALVGRCIAGYAAASEHGPRAVIRVRHREDDGVARRRMRLADGCLEEVAR